VVLQPITATITNGSGSYLFQWQVSPNGTSGWANASSGNGQNYNVPTGVPGTYYYRLIVTDVANGCNDPISNVVNVIVNNQPDVTISVDNDLVCIGGISTITSVVTNGSGLFNYQWQSSPNGSTWTNIAVNGNNATYVSTAAAAGTTYYRVMVTDLANGCNDPVSNPITITVENQPTVSISIDNQVVCIGGSASITSSILNGSGVFTYQWQSSPNGSSSWINIAVNGTGANYTPPTSSAGTTYYRLLVTDLSNGCNDPMSNTVNLVVQNQPTVSVAVDNPVVCVGGSSTITSTISNGSGFYTYQWQSSPDGSGSWTNITSGGVGPNYFVPTSTPGTLYYRVLVTDLSNNCNDPISNVVQVTVQPQASVTIAASNEIVCIGGSSVLTPTITGGSGTYLYQWQSSPNGTNSWANIVSGGNGSTYNVPTTVAGTTYYRLMLTDVSNGCNDPMSNTVSVVVNPQPTVSVAVDNPIVCIGGSSTITSTINNGSGLFNYQWQSSPNGSSGWANIVSGGNGPNYNVPTSTAGTTYYRLLVTDLANGCNDPMSNTVNVVVNNPATVTISVNNNLVCVGGSSTITSTINNGSGLYNYQWQSSPDGSSAWSDITTNGNGANYSVPTTSAGTTYYRILVTDLANGCPDPMSNVLSVTIANQPTVSISVDNPNVCVGGSSLITSEILDGSGVYNYQWQQSANGSSGWANVPSGGNGPTYNVPTSVAGTTYYRMLLTDLSNGCNDPMSNVVNVVVTPQPTVSITVDNPVVCIGGSSTITSTVSNGSGFFLYQWQTSPNGSSSWTNVITGGNGPNYNVPTASAGTAYYRIVVTDLSNNCNDPISNNVQVTIQEQASVTIAATNEVVCINGSSVINSTISNGSGLYNYQWQQSANGTSGWVNVPSGGNAASYNVPTAIAGTTYYRLLLTDLGNGCNDPMSNVVNVVVNPQPTVSVSVDNPVVCVGGSSTITSTLNNGSGFFNYQWQQSANGTSGWANVPSGGNGPGYNVPTGVAGTTYYRLVVTDLANGCNDPISNVVNVAVHNQPEVSISVDNDLVCVGGTSLLTAVITNGSGFYNYQWQSSIDNSNWVSISPNGTNASYTSVATGAGTTYYRLLLTDLSNGCTDPVSNSVTITVVNQPTVSISVDNPNVCIGGTSLITSEILEGSGVYNYQWQQSANGSSGWSNVSSGGNGPTYNVPTSVAGTTYYRMLLTDLSNGCTDPISNVVNVVVTPQPTVSIAVNNPVVCVGGSSTITSTVSNGSGFFLYQWQISPDGSSAWTNVTVGGSGPNYNVPTAVAGTAFYRIIVTDLSNNCNDPISNTVQVTIQESATLTIEATNSVVCINGSSVINSTITGGSGIYNYQWQQSANGSSGWANVPSGGNGANYTVPTTTAGTTYYRLMLTDLANGCPDPISNVVDVTVVSQVSVSVAVDNPVVCVGGSSTITSTLNNGSGFFNYQWQQSPNGSSSWTNVPSGGNGPNYNVPTGAAGTTYYRLACYRLV
jgi:hypothetical protein